MIKLTTMPMKNTVLGQYGHRLCRCQMSLRSVTYSTDGSEFGQYDLVPECVGPHYIRHDEAGNRTVTLDAYAAEIAKIREERPDIRVVVYDHSFKGDRAWFRFAFKWTDPKTGEPRSRAGMQSYRIEVRTIKPLPSCATRPQDAGRGADLGQRLRRIYEA
jgi:hypothetical protein